MPKPALLDLISARSRWLAARQAVLTQNVANADTPDYRPLDLRQPPPGPRAPLAGQRVAGPRPVALAVTHAVHMAGSPAPAAGDPRARETDGFETSPSGNAVVLDEQLEKLGETQLGYELATNLYRRHVGMQKTALGLGG